MFCLQSSSYGPPSEVHSNRETSGWRSRLSATCLFQILVGKSDGQSVGLAVSSGKGKIWWNDDWVVVPHHQR